jgi:uncharacterized membrane protein
MKKFWSEQYDPMNSLDNGRVYEMIGETTTAIKVRRVTKIENNETVLDDKVYRITKRYGTVIECEGRLVQWTDDVNEVAQMLEKTAQREAEYQARQEAKRQQQQAEVTARNNKIKALAEVIAPVYETATVINSFINLRHFTWDVIANEANRHYVLVVRVWKETNVYAQYDPNEPGMIYKATVTAYTNNTQNDRTYNSSVGRATAAEALAEIIDAWL